MTPRRLFEVATKATRAVQERPTRSHHEAPQASQALLDATQPTRPKAGTDRAYRRFVRTLPCAASIFSKCIGTVDPHHAGKRPGVGLKAHDRTCVPLCRGHHHELHALSGPFARWTREDRNEWLAEVVKATQLLATPEDLGQGRDMEALGLGRLEVHDGKWSWVAGDGT